MNLVQSQHMEAIYENAILSGVNESIATLELACMLKPVCSMYCHRVVV